MSILSRSLIGEGLKARDLRTGSRVTTPIPQGEGKAQWEDVLDQLWMAPGNAAHGVSFGLSLLMCSAWFAETVLMFRDQKHQAKLVWVMKMLPFDS